jgi:hypothetical protein
VLTSKLSFKKLLYQTRVVAKRVLCGICPWEDFLRKLLMEKQDKKVGAKVFFVRDVFFRRKQPKGTKLVG